MSALDYYERHLLALAVEACDRRELRLIVEHDMRHELWLVGRRGLDGRKQWTNRDTLADALTALLTDLGVPVPERPSAEAVREWRRANDIGDGPTAYYAVELEVLHARDPLLAAAVLEGA